MKIDIRITSGYHNEIKIHAKIENEVHVIPLDVAEEIIKRYLETNGFNTELKGKQVYKRIVV